MAFDNDQSESMTTMGNNSKRTSVDLLPKYFRTSPNKKFLNATVDQLISEGNVEKLNVFIGRKDTPAYQTSDRYLKDVSESRQAYQLEPSIVSKDDLDNITYFKDYNDYVNQLSIFAGNEINHDKANREEFYAWNPHIDWDKFVNYREYYWLPNGPQSIEVVGERSTNVIKNYEISLSREVDNIAYLFNPEGPLEALIRNPVIKLYRGETYIFDIDCEERPIAIKSSRTTGQDNFYTQGIQIFDENNVLITSDFLSKGRIEFTVPERAPNVLYYVSEKDIDSSGYFEIYDRTDLTEIDVEKEIVGLKNYTTSRGVTLSNGMKVFFQGIVTPEKYAKGNWYVEGVGKAIVLVSESDLETPSNYTADQEIEFDNENFDTQGFDVNSNFPKDKDYITINRASKDRNPWSRHNRWFHKEVIDNSASANNQTAVIDPESRAKRPIIEFEPNLQLFNFGKVSKFNVTLIDDSTTDVFSNIEGSIGYYVDQVQLVEGMRVLFIADNDPLVYGRIFKVSSVTHLGIKRLTLLTEEDSEPLEGQCVLSTQGVVNRGKTFHYHKGKWILAQEKIALNQSPMFDLVDDQGLSYSDEKYIGSTFKGTKLFSYKPGNIVDQELKFGVSYKNIGNFGDLLFEFNLHTESFSYQENFQTVIKNLDLGYLIINRTLNDFRYVNGWTIAESLASQYLVTEITVDRVRNFFEINMYENITSINEVEFRVFVNGKVKYDIEYSISVVDGIFYLEFFSDLNEDDFLIIKTKSKLEKKSGYFEIPANLENNPENLSLTDFTLGEINNHVKSIIDSLPNFRDTIPGKTSLRDLGNITPLGTKVVQHSAPILPISYHITNKDFNVVKAIRLAKEEYAKFKRNFLRTASTLGYDGIVRNHLDLILAEITKDYTSKSSYYLSDMIPTNSCFVFDQEVIDNSVTDYPLIFDFDLTEANEKAVLIYLNEDLILHGKDYIFVNQNFVRILCDIQNGDSLKICQYESTDGCFCPPTPSKLGLYPLFEPKIFIDDTYQEPTKVIQGHDGSITVAFDDYRDDLILEFEKRIFNNVKIKYNSELFNIYDFVPGNYRTTDFTKEEINTVIAQDFLNWTSLISDDYTKHDFYQLSNAQTYNYKKFSTNENKLLPGFWRAIFKEFYDTDRPNTRPWEMLGFSLEPKWWKDLYGPAPYTSDNLILWNDLKDGIIREPGVVPRVDKKFVRPDLLSYIPVDGSGNIKAPLDIGFIKDFDINRTKLEFSFGDQAPIESAWRRSSEYPFALIRALTILAPARVFSTCFDRARQVRDSTGQIVYKLTDGYLRFNIDNIKVTSTSVSAERITTSGLINYVVDFIIRNQSPEYVENYVEELKNLEMRLATKLGGFTTKDKFKLILDSRNPLNKTNVFVPEENYNIILNTSSPLETVIYSGVIVEKSTSGFIIKGYSRSFPYFKYFPYREATSDPTINVGGISEPYVDWAMEKFYHKGRIVRNAGFFYRTKEAHTSSQVFEEKYYVKLPKLPIEGGRDIKIRTSFEDQSSTLVYGTELATVQEVVDFLLGYGEYLTSLGFKFSNFNSEIKNVTDFQISAKEFAFWTTQNWAAGAAITLSPLAESVDFQRDYAIVDNIFNNFYDYSVFKQDGRPLDPSFTSNVRADNGFSLKSKNTTDGIYHIALNLVQKEHVLILDNITVFNDVIYDQIQGYRQERIKVIGYRTSEWQGSLSVPGFVYDQAKITSWKPWTDYKLGDTVKFKEFYYSAISNISGAEEFDFNEWYKLESKPESKLIPNWSYRANQFADFYDLDTDSFDVDQQKFAQHLIGYQKREYLQNIINDEVSQYKFYQGMIQDKGTNNSLSKLFNALSSSSLDSLEFYDEWAVRVGQYGANQSFDEVEFLLEESKFLINPQPIELVKSINPNSEIDFIYRILPHETYIAPQNYGHAPFPTKSISSYYVSTAGFARSDDIDVVLVNKSDILTIDINSLKEGDNLQVAYDKNSWNIYRFTFFENKVSQFIQNGTTLRIVFGRNVDYDLVEGEYVGINNTLQSLEGFHEIIGTGFNYIEITKPQALNLLDLTSLSVSFYKFVSVKLNSLDDVNSLSILRKNNGDLVWVDDPNNNWKVWKYENNFTKTIIDYNAESFSKTFTVDSRNLTLIVSSNEEIYYYVRPSEKVNWVYKGQITELSTQSGIAELDLLDNSFGKNLKVSSSSNYLVISAPSAKKTVGLVSYNNVGYVAFYSKDRNNYFVFKKTVRSNNPIIANEYFGEFLEITDEYLFVISKGSLTVGPSIYLFNINKLEEIAGNFDLTSIEAYLHRINLPVGTVILETSVDNNNILAVSFANQSIKFYKVNSNNNLEQVQELNSSSVPTLYALNSNSNFASSISLSKDGRFLAVGIFNYRQTRIGEGAVAVYKKNQSNQFAFNQFISNKFKKENEKFGFKVALDTSGSRLAVTSAGGQQEELTYFDNDTTLFDQDSTQFIEVELSVGSVSLFDVYNDKFIYSDNLSVGDAIGINYGSKISVTNRVYISDYSETTGAVYEFYSKDRSWYVFREPTDIVDLNRIKSVFLYNTESNQLVTYLDAVDPLQGKILGIAEQELSYKTYYDPAVYSVGTDEVSVDDLRSWKSSNVGKLWWDLSSTKFIDSNQGSILFKTNAWNKSYLDKIVDIYEWVESEYLPSEWDSIADTEAGISQGISGSSKYGDSVYAVNKKYDSISSNFKNVYYFWVKNKSLVPNIENRKISAKDVADYISNPKDKGISYVTIFDKDKFALVNCKNFLADSKIAINFRYWITDNFQQTNIHSHYQLVSPSDISKPINKYIEQKWFDSLSGFDKFGNPVPDKDLPEKNKYGILNRPRQSMFINRVEALKQFIERVNYELRQKTIIDDFDFSKLNSKELPPSEGLGQYDTVINTYSQIRFVSVNEFKQARITPIVDNGRIIRVVINDPGQGYKIAPNVVIEGTGSGAEIKTQIDTFGKIINATVVQTGSGYLDGVKLKIRSLTVLVLNDEFSSNKWAIYYWIPLTRKWFKEKVQTYDTTRFWRYIDWYAEGYNSFVRPKHLVDFTYELKFNSVNLGDIVKVKNTGSGGWILLEKINDSELLDTTVNYKTIGRENGTIEFLNGLYNFSSSSLGFDGFNFDSNTFDDVPKEELLIILDVIKNNIFIDDLAEAYKELFFASLRYAFKEQKSVDWAFKTSFVRAKHNLGTLKQKINYLNDNLESYQDYINEVKPYRSKVREFVSNYEAVDNTYSQVSDFDLPVRYNSQTESIEPFETKVVNGLIQYNSDDILNFPYSDWYYNVGAQLVSIDIADSGEGYLYAPEVIIKEATSDITAKAFISNGRLTKITFLDPLQERFLKTPEIELIGSVGDTGRHGRAVAILGNSLVRSSKIGIKFDRLSPTYTYNTISVSENFVGTGNKTKFELKWPIDIIITKTNILENGIEILPSDYQAYNELDKTSEYTRYKGVIQFNLPPANLSNIVISYKKNINLLDAADRIRYFYNPGPGQLGKDLGQLMTGVDYGGVEVVGVDFDIGSGWDAIPWNFAGYDKFDETFTDFFVTTSAHAIFKATIVGTTMVVKNIDITSGKVSIGMLLTGTGIQPNTFVTEILGPGSQPNTVNYKISVSQTVNTLPLPTITGVIRKFYLPYIPNEIEIVNIYLNGVRLDDPNYTVVSPLIIDLNNKKATLTQVSNELIQAKKDYDFWDLRYNTTADEKIAKDNEVTAQTAVRDFYTPGSVEWIIENNKLIILQNQQTELFQQNTQAFVERGNAQTQITNKTAEVAVAQAAVNLATAALANETAIVNTSAVMNSYIGNGVDNGPIIIPANIPLPQGSRLIFRKSTSDGSFTPLQYDTQLYGGDFSYNSASGIAPEDIIVDGDGFVTPDSSHAPEEFVTGHITDAVDITVYHKHKDGAPVIENLRYIIQGTNRIFNIGQIPGTIDAVIVKIDGIIKTLDIDYEVDFQNLEVVINQNLINNSQGKILTVDSFSQNGSNLLDLDYFVGDGVTKEFVTAARWPNNITIFVTVNGIPAIIEAGITDDSYDKVGNVLFELATPPAAGSIISYIVLGSIYNSISIVSREVINFTGESTYPLQFTVGVNSPLSSNLLVIKDGLVLRSTDTLYFTVSGNNRTYNIDISKYALNSLDSRFISVAVNGVLINEGTGYNWISSSNQVKVKKGVASSGDRLSISILANADYEVTANSIKFLNNYSVGDTFTIISFTNHNILNIERSTAKLVSASSLTAGTLDYARFYQSVGGRFKLNDPAVGSEYIWVARNRQLLIPIVDYILEDNLNYVVINKSLNLTDSDTIEIIVFSSDTIRKPFAYKIFKDMLNKTRYSRIDDTISTHLAKELKSYDTSITIVDSTGLAEPNPEFNRSGVIFIEGERIEYFKKIGNVLSQLKRGTLGTGVKNTYPIGTLVRDQSPLQTVPYKDEFESLVDLSDGQNRLISLNFTPKLAQSSIGTSWYRNTIPASHGQSNDIEVFVGGKRLRKSPVKIFNPTLGPDSPSGDQMLEAEFSVDGISAAVRLTTVPLTGTKIEVIRKIGKTWAPNGLTLENSPSEQAKFIRSVSALLPDSTKK